MSNADFEYREGLTREDVEHWQGSVVLNFGTNWCGYCQAAKQPIEQALQEVAEVRHVAVEDGPGRKLGRSFGIKLWPTLVFTKDGQEITRLVRPSNSEEIHTALRSITEV